MALGLEIMLWFFINAFNMVLFTFSYFMDETIINIIKISYDFFASNESFKFILNLRDSTTGSITKNFFNLPNFITDHTYTDIKDFSIFDCICATFFIDFPNFSYPFFYILRSINTNSFSNNLLFNI